MESILKNKKGEDPGMFENIIFIVLNTIFFLAMIYFINRSGSGATTYEQAYAKEIALLIDQAKAGTTILLDVGDGLQIASKNGKTSDLITIDNTKNEVVVSFDTGGGYKYRYFSDYDVSYKLSGNYLTISVQERGENVSN